MPEDTQMTNEEIREMLVTAPVWDSIVWDAIQQGDYALTESRFADLLKGELESGEWSKVYWDGILSGIPSFRGDVEILSWSTSVLPALARAILKTATPRNLEIVYQSLSLERARGLHSLFITSIPGNDLLKKKVWLQEQNPTLLKFFNTNIAGFSLEAVSENLLSRQGFSRAQVLPENLLRVLFSSEVAAKINEISETNKLTEDQTRNVAIICGSAILGLMKISDLPKTIQEKCRTEEALSLLIEKSLEEKVLASLKKDIEASAPPNPFAITNNASMGGGVSVRPEVLPVSPSIPPVEKKNPIFSPLPTTSSATIPQTLTQKTSEPFFKKWTEEGAPHEPKDITNKEEPSVGPKIIQEEMRAQSLSTAPKLGFRVSNDKLRDAQEKAAPLRAAELTMSDTSGEGSSTPSSSRESVQKMNAPISPLGAKLSMGGESFPKPTTSSSGFLGKIRDSFSRETTDKISDIPVPPPPQEVVPTTTQGEVKPSQPVVLKVVVQEDAKKEVIPPQSATFPIAQKNPIPATPQILEIKKEGGSAVIPTPTTAELPPPPPSKLSSPTAPIEVVQKPEPIPPKTPPAMPRVDLRKMSDITIEKIPSPAQEEKPGFLSRLFGKKSVDQKTVIVPPAEKKSVLPATTDAPNKITPVEHPNAPLPPPPPAPPKTPELPKTINEKTVQVLPVQKFSPLTNFQKKLESQPLSQNPAKVVETVSSIPRVVNYSEYPLRTDPLKQPE